MTALYTWYQVGLYFDQSIFHDHTASKTPNWKFVHWYGLLPLPWFLILYPIL